MNNIQTIQWLRAKVPGLLLQEAKEVVELIAASAIGAATLKLEECVPHIAPEKAATLVSEAWTALLTPAPPPPPPPDPQQGRYVWEQAVAAALHGEHNVKSAVKIADEVRDEFIKRFGGQTK